MADHRYAQARKLKLFRQDPRCFYCRRYVSLYLGAEFRNRSKPNDYATIDHKDSRAVYAPGKRPHLWGKKTNLVLCCYKCNKEKSIEESKVANSRFSKWEKWKSSGSFPRYLFFLKWVYPNSRDMRKQPSDLLKQGE